MTLYEIAIVEDIKNGDGDVIDMKVLVAPTPLVALDDKAVAMEAILANAGVLATANRKNVKVLVRPFVQSR